MLMINGEEVKITTAMVNLQRDGSNIIVAIEGKVVIVERCISTWMQRSCDVPIMCDGWKGCTLKHNELPALYAG